jgi:hypothetical protein
MIRLTRCLTIATALVGVACRSPRRFDPSELVLAAAAADSVNIALADSLHAGGPVVSQAGEPVGELSACSDHLDGRGWASAGTHILELQLPPGFALTSESDQSVEWRGPGGSLRASSSRGDAHSPGYGTVTSECDVFTSGSPTHIDLVTSEYGRSVSAFIKPSDAPAIRVEGQSTTVTGQAQLLHAIRSARVSAAWGRKY